jgi:hypothetical protein
MKLTYTSEQQVVNSVLHYLNGRGHFVWRNNSGVARAVDKRGRERLWRAGIKGSADIIGVAKDGKFIAVECKHGKNKTTESQDMFLKDVRDRGGYAVVAYDIEDLPKELL